MGGGKGEGVCVCVCVRVHTLCLTKLLTPFLFLACLHRAGAELRESHAVKSAVFDKSKGLWTVTVEGSEETFTVSHTCTQRVCPFHYSSVHVYVLDEDKCAVL